MGANMIQRALGGANADDVNHFLKITFLENYKQVFSSSSNHTNVLWA